MAADTYSQIRGKETPFCFVLFTGQWLHAQEKTLRQTEVNNLSYHINSYYKKKSYSKHVTSFG
jgi:hypothetical protein